MFEKFRGALAGSKTYLVSVGAIIAALIAYASNQIEVAEMIRLIIEAILAITIRAGIAKKK